MVEDQSQVCLLILGRAGGAVSWPVGAAGARRGQTWQYQA